MKVKVAVSARHVHLDKETKDILFPNIELTKYKDLSQKGQFACNEKVTLKTDKAEFKNVRILGPLRPKTQVEVSKTDAIKLGINPPVRDSGDLDNSESISIISDYGEVTIDEGVIIAQRHIHVDPETSKNLNLVNYEEVTIKNNSERGGSLDHTLIRVDESFVYECHIDTDESNALYLNTGDEVEIIKNK